MSRPLRLGAEETERLFEQIGRLKSEGVSFIYISHRLDEIARIADRVVVLRDGQLVATHDTAQVPVKTLVEEMVGRPLDRMFPEIPAPSPSAPLIEVEGLTSSEGAFADVSFSVRPGEIFGVAGIVGAGRTELMRAISGADPIAAGRVKVNGDVLKLSGPRDALDHGVVLVPEDRKAQGLILPQTIAENLALGNYPRVAPSGWITSARTLDFAAKGISRFQIKGTGSQLVSELSGGNQQKVVIAKTILREPKVVILDEPTRGIDVGARAAIYEIIADLARSGMAVIIVIALLLPFLIRIFSFQQFYVKDCFCLISKEMVGIMAVCIIKEIKEFFKLIQICIGYRHKIGQMPFVGVFFKDR